ncbi:HAD-IA family hydrolase [Archangium violaceum]|uniref:HAD family hydrolase n=1 Tax=Archangium violaceum TaxID=83451 RepID=UPI00194FA6EF|nr:HAD-IA family hydrolase [Archangium violaceum]QRO00301.1 HAD-IA family hydrolase [Archangium violaceum]
MTPMHKTIVFDLDGTLVDSLPDIIASFQYSLMSLGLPVPTDTEVRVLIGHPLEEMFEHFAPGQDVTRLCSIYREHYPRNFVNRSRPFPGVLELLRTLRERGYKLAIATTKRTDMARRFVEALGMMPMVDHVQGTDGFPHKPAPDVIHRALGALGGAKGLWMVGDTTADMQAGRAAGLRTYGVTWGNHDAALLATATPDEIQPDLGQLLQHLPPLPRA